MANDYICRQDTLDAFGLSEKTRKYGGDHSGYDTRMLYEIQDTIESLEPADVVPVVRCKDCKHCYFADNRVPDEQGWVCEINSSEPVNLNDFCSYGERREE